MPLAPASRGERSPMIGLAAGALGGMIGMLAMEFAQRILAGGDSSSNLAQQDTASLSLRYGMGALCGGVYGLAAEYVPGISGGFGTIFGTSLTVGSALLAWPALEPVAAREDATPRDSAARYAAHAVYGGTTEALRRVLRTS